MFEKLMKRGIPPRHRRAAYMNLAFRVLPTAADALGAWDTPPDPLEDITDEVPETHFCVADGVNSKAQITWLQIDLGTEYEVYEINVRNLAGEGFNQAVAAIADINVTLESGITGQTPATSTSILDTQVVGHGGLWEDSTLHYVGEGVRMRYVWIMFTPDGANNMNVDLSEIEVFGC